MPDDFGFEFARPEFYFYLNQTGVYTVDGTNDAEDYNCLRVKIIVIRILKILLWYKTLLQINQYKTFRWGKYTVYNRNHSTGSVHRDRGPFLESPDN